MAGPAQVLIEAFENRFKTTPDLFRAPGRVNLIGEHTDYNFGFVLPIAIDLACYSASARNRDGVLRVYSLNFNEGREWPIERIASLQPTQDWSDYVIGVVRQIPQTRGRDVMIYSSVPVGSGLSSSAALEVSTALAAGWELSLANRLDLAQLCRRAENDFAGVPSGIMDQYVSVFGERKSAVQIDCRSLDHKLVSLPEDVSIIAVDSMVKHALGGSAYRDRVAECAEAARVMGHSLRDARSEHLALIHDPVVLKRARHVITEDQRVQQFVAASERGDLAEMGRLFLASHRSLRDNYEVSCEELDFLVDAAMDTGAAYGARMTGGGFGGCTVNLVKPGSEDAFELAVREAYQNRFGKEPGFYRVRAAEGASKIS